MFLLIMMFFFTNVFLWHDRATREMDGVLSEKMNSLVNIEWKNESDANPQPSYRGTLYVSNTGGVDAQLSRLWIIESTAQQDTHTCLDLEGEDLRVPAGDSVKLKLYYSGSDQQPRVDADKNIYYQWTTETKFKILTTSGNIAACIYDFSDW
jgi:hypothetical protein